VWVSARFALCCEPRPTRPNVLEAATALLDAGASANTGFYVNDEFESVLYGAAGVAHDAGLTRLHQAIRRDNDIETIALLLDHDADPSVPARGRSATAMTAWEGRGDVLKLIKQRGLSTDLHGVDRLIAACATNSAEEVRLLAREPALIREIVAQDGALLGEFAGIGHSDGIRHLLDLGANIRTIVVAGDGYWGISTKSTALHVAAWRARHATVKLLMERGAPVDVQDGKGQTPLMLAVRACVDSYWKDWRSPESVAALLAAGASIDGVDLPTGYAEIDTLLARGGSVGHEPSTSRL
jgi:ankyrin repeat protein